MLVDFDQPKKQIETRRNATVDIDLQQTWFLEAKEKLKKKRDYIIFLLIIDILMGIIFLLI